MGFDYNVLLVAVGAGMLFGSAVAAAILKFGSVTERQVLTAGAYSDNRLPSADVLGKAVLNLGERIAEKLPFELSRSSDLDTSLRLSGSNKTAAQVWAEQLACGVMVAGLASILGSALGFGRFFLLLLVIGGAVGFAAPRLLMMMQRSRWHTALSRQLPDALDILCVAVNSGSTLEDGMRIVGETMDGELAEVFARIVTQAGPEGVAAAFHEFADTTGLDDLRNVSFAIWHATESGAPIASVLASQADLMRTARRQKIEERSEHLDNQMTIDIGLLIMPAVFIGALAPFIYYIATELLGSGMI